VSRPSRLPTSPAAGQLDDEELAPVDTLLIYADADPRKRSSLIGLLLLDRTPKWSDLVATVERATHRSPRLRQRVVSPLLPISRPHWVADPDFDLSYHLRHVRIPHPGGVDELMTLAELSEMAPLDPARPLWEITLVEGLRTPDAAGEQSALLWKFSHALGDGVGVLQIALGLLDLEPKPHDDPGLQPNEETPTRKSRTALLRDRLIELPVDLTTDVIRSGLWATSAGLKAASDPRGAAGGVIGFARSLQRLITPPAARPSPVLRQRGTRRRLLVHEVPLERLKLAGRAVGASVNDAYLAGVLGALRRYHEAVGFPVDKVPMAVPVYGRPGAATGLDAAENAPGGNHFSAIRFAAPVSEPDPGARMREVHDLVAAGRDEPALGAVDAIARVFARTPQVLVAEIARQQGQLDVQASNVAGFPGQVYLAGAAVDRMYSFGPTPGVAVMFVLVSYNGTCGIGVTIDEAAIRDIALFARCIADGFNEVLELATPAEGPAPQPTSAGSLR
jgi:WS/DGAT/MGAT family acyltransferase